MKINCLIIDDEPLALKLIESYVAQTPFLELKGTCLSALEAIEILKEHKIDLVFLDIQMPLLNGLEFSRIVGENTKVVFTTAFEKYAIEGFKVDAIDYLLKPVSYAEFLNAAVKARRRIEMELGEGSRSRGRKAENESIFVKADYKIVQIELSEITYIEGVKDYIKIHTLSAAPVMTLSSIKSIEEKLPSETFQRVHRSFIVNLNNIKEIEKSHILFGRIRIPISDSYREAVMEKINARILKK